ncbi:MAG: hypothetical protein GWP18_05550 [Proteobacteria bacterium]|nr:hypothetical protein [Pseudomonadota bacterium]
MRRFLILSAAMAVLAASCTSSADTTTSVPSTSSTATVAPSTTSSAPATDPPAATTTSVPVTNTAPAVTTTTTEPDPPAVSVELSDEGVQAGDTRVQFGFDDEDAIAAVAAVLGEPSLDSGWIDSFSGYGTCPGSVIRGVEWDDFVMLFTRSDTAFWTGGVPHFFSYYYTGDKPELFTTEGIGVGSSVEMLEAAYGGTKYTMDESFFDPAVGAWMYDLHDWTSLWGYATGQSGAHVVTSINGGRGCGE